MGRYTSFYEAGFTTAQVNLLKALDASELATLLALSGGGLTTGVTAYAGGGQANAVELTNQYTNVTVCATAGDSVKLDSATVGLWRTVRNSGAATLAVFPATGDSINGLAVNLSIDVPPLCEVTFRAISTTVWYSTPIKLYLSSPTTQTGGLVLVAAASAANYITTITNASQAAARTYTIPDAGANASFVMTAGAQTITGTKTFGNVAIGTNLVQVDSKSYIDQTTVCAGASGTAGVFSVYPSTASKGHTDFTAADNTSNTTTTIATLGQAAVRQYSIPDWSTKASSDSEVSLAGIKVVTDTTNRPGALGCLLFATGDSKLYVCTTASATAATWTVVGSQS